MKYFISIYLLFFINFSLGCQRQIDALPAAIEFVEFPISHPNVQDDEDWLFNPNADFNLDSNGQISPLELAPSYRRVRGASSQNTTCTEIITVDFEPYPFGNLVQTIPHHLEKESMNNAFISVKMITEQIPWVIFFYSENVLFAQQALVAFDDYDGDLDRYISSNQNICEVHLWDTLQAHEYLYNFEQLIAEIEIHCY